MNINDFLSRAQFIIAPIAPFLSPAIIFTGDAIQIVLPAIALLFDCHRYYKNELSGWELLNTVSKVVFTSIATHAIKKIARGTIYDIRPNGRRGSFPSGHTSAAFGGAFLIHQIFGWAYGRYAYVLASFTAFARVHGRYHHVRDVAAGALTALSMTVLVDMIIPTQPGRLVLFNNLQQPRVGLQQRRMVLADRPIRAIA